MEWIRMVAIAAVAVSCQVAIAGLTLENEDFTVQRVYPRNRIEKLADGRDGVRVTFFPGEYAPGKKARFPAVVLSPATGKCWDFSSWSTLSATVENCEESMVPVFLRLQTLTPEGKERQTMSFFLLAPREKRKLSLKFSRVDPACAVDLGRIDNAPEGACAFPNVYPERTTGICITTTDDFPGECTEGRTIVVTDIRLSGTVSRCVALTSPAKFFPFIDRYGQYVHAEWPGKIHHDEELPPLLAAERRQLAALPPLSGRNRFGGWSDGPQRKATGFFRTEKVAGKWTLIDPEGRLFLSFGMNAVRVVDTGNNRNVSNWFAEPLPPSGIPPFCRRNLEWKYQPFRQERWVDHTFLRLTRWGFNTLGAWTMPELYRARRMPYMVEFGDKLKSARFPNRKFYDAFDPAFGKALDALFAEEWQFTASDPWCIGYFVFNELVFDERLLAEEVTVAPPEMAAKREFARLLQQKYRSIEALNRAWNAKFPSFAEFLAAREKRYDVENAAADLKEFSRALVEQFYSECRAVIRRNAPNHLYLGARNMPVDFLRGDVIAIASRFCDVLSINTYQPVSARLDGGPGAADVPILISEYSFLVSDRGRFIDRTAGRTQADRAQAFRRNWESMLANPRIVGAHWYCYQDQPLAGRNGGGTGENRPFGFVDVTDTPYAEMTAASRSLAKTLYEIRFHGETTSIGNHSSRKEQDK